MRGAGDENDLAYHASAVRSQAKRYKRFKPKSQHFKCLLCYFTAISFQFSIHLSGTGGNIVNSIICYEKFCGFRQTNFRDVKSVTSKCKLLNRLYEGAVDCRGSDRIMPVVKCLLLLVSSISFSCSSAPRHFFPAKKKLLGTQAQCFLEALIYLHLHYIYIKVAR